ncbi:DUF6660 family protein [Pontibacter silvestris]|uniref:DUF6660 family protein n=1 Tax=Pontibacter silvestris TaxID=2305183 RepID=A0ABW4X446_9BACT
MKVLTIILIILVVALSVLPCCMAGSCSDNEVKTEQTDNHDNGVDTCSPFYSCATCVGFTVSSSSLESVQPFRLFKSSYFAHYKQRTFTQYYHPIWQPPKIS